MPVMSARDFNRDVSAAKRAAEGAPVIITDRGEPAYVLLTVTDYEELRHGGRGLVARLSMDDDIDFDPEPAELSLKVPDL
jgi:antitoxin (DNA-binding transcriptional repressor) of toxin-antitoxin stability system